MNWKMKALIQRAVSQLPSRASFALYYKLQRACGNLRSVNPIEGFEDALRLIAAIESVGGTIVDKVLLEVGTGRRINVPIAMWLCGAARTITIDLNPYLKPNLVQEDLGFIRTHQREVLALFGPRGDTEEFQRRFAVLTREAFGVREFLEAARIQYFAPVDARRLALADGSLDYHMSNNVLEHIPPGVLRDILREGKRLIRDDGLLVHRIDFSDHFSAVDDGISTVNFLQYSEKQWRRYAGNRYNYHNRLRIDELERIVDDAELVVAGEQVETDPAALRLIETGFSLDPRFAAKPKEVNAAKSAVMMLARRPWSAGVEAHA